MVSIGQRGARTQTPGDGYGTRLPFPAQGGIVVRTLSDQVFEIVRDRVVTGSLPDDAPIRQDALAGELGVSKIPLREALGRLEQEGLLVSQPNRGYSVRPMSAEQADEVYALRLPIEPAAAAYAARQADDAGRAAAMAASEAVDRIRAAATATDVAAAQRRFHIALVHPGGRALTTQLVERMAVIAERYVIAHLATRPAPDHRALVEAWMARDSAMVEALLAKDLRDTRTDLRTRLAALATMPS